MGIIHVLDSHVANQIAAGEVVERPASVVKELVENAIDAGADRIEVTVEDGGMAFIGVADNGKGMAEDDIETAFERHATSKIATGGDLFRIGSLGFRGEALPSIAAVAKVECLSSTADDGRGRRFVIEGGRRVAHEPAACGRGTELRVRDLFYNTPARLKYMKTVQTEFGHISDYLYRTALAHPDIALSVSHNGNALFRTLGNGDLLQVIAAIYGSSSAKQMVEVVSEDLDYRIRGFVSRPELTRSNRSGLTTVVNGRVIRNYGLAAAVLQAYHTLLPINRYPLGVLQIAMDPTLVDVNVHPAKLEVRFSKEPELVRFVERAVNDVLKRQVLIQNPLRNPSAKPAVVQEKLSFGPGSGKPGAEPRQDETRVGKRAGEPDRTAASSIPWEAPAARLDDGDAFTAREAPAARWESGVPGSFQTSGQAGGARPAPAAGTGQPGAGTRPYGEPDRRSRPQAPSEWRRDQTLAPDKLEAVYAPPRTEAEKPAFPEMYPVGQVHGTYIVAQNESGMFLIDQHAAHERINYERFFELFGSPEPASQELLVPISLDFTPSDASALKERLPLLEQVGVMLEPFGGNSFLVRSYPHWIPTGEERGIIEEMCDWVLTEKQRVDIAKLREKSAILCSCKASIKANDRMSASEMQALLERLAKAKNPYTCPHGRPIVISFSTYELEKMFKRVM